MNTKVKITTLVVVSIVLLACNLGTSAPAVTQAVQTGAVQIVTEAPTQEPPTLTVALTATVEQATPTATQDAAAAQAVVLDACTLITAAEAEVILAEPAGTPTALTGTCIYSNAKDALYLVSVAAAQEQESIGILQGQMMMLGMGGAQFDEVAITKMKSLAEALDYQGFFSELVAVSGNAPTFQARLVEDASSDLVYWTWISAQTRRQGAYVAARGQTLVNVNLVVADTQTEEAMLAAAKAQAEQAFARLPAKFTLAAPEQAPTQEATLAPTLEPTPVPSATLVPPAAAEKTIVGLWERISGETTERLEFRADGNYFIEARKTSSNEIVVSNNGTFTYDDSSIFYVDKNKKETAESYYLDQEGDLLVINDQKDMAWTRLK